MNSFKKKDTPTKRISSFVDFGHILLLKTSHTQVPKHLENEFDIF